MTRAPPALEEGRTYRVHLGGAIEGAQENGLYTEITAYTPGMRMQHGAGSPPQRGSGMQGMGGRFFPLAALTGRV